MNGHRNLSQRARRRIGVVVTIAATLVASVGLAAPANAGNHYFMDFGNTAVKQADCGPGRHRRPDCPAMCPRPTAIQDAANAATTAI